MVIKSKWLLDMLGMPKPHDRDFKQIELDLIQIPAAISPRDGKSKGLSKNQTALCWATNLNKFTDYRISSVHVESGSL